MLLGWTANPYVSCSLSRETDRRPGNTNSGGASSLSRKSSAHKTVIFKAGGVAVGNAGDIDKFGRENSGHDEGAVGRG